MIKCFFGIPGVGKTTIGTKIARKELKRIKRGRSKYDAVYTDFYCKGCHKIDYNDLSIYKVYNALIILDEMTLNADNRKFKEFSDAHRDYFILHRHIDNDIIYLTQDYSKVDSKIRALTQDLWYMSKSVIPILNMFTTCKRIYRTITINEHTGDLIMGYRFCNFLESIFASNFMITFRPLYYKYFNSYDELSLSDRPILPKVPWSSVEEKRFSTSTILRSISKSFNFNKYKKNKFNLKSLSTRIRADKI